MKTSTGHEIKGIIENHYANLDDEVDSDRKVYPTVAIDEDTADTLGSVWCTIRLSAHYRRQSGWTDLEATFVSDVDDELLPTEYESLGEVGEIEILAN